MKIKTIFFTLLLLATNQIFAVVPTMDVNVMQKDTQAASQSMTVAIQMMDQIRKGAENVSTAKNLVSGLQSFMSLDLSKFCPSCSTTTIEDLQKWKDQNGKNVCEQMNNQLKLVNGHITNLSDISNLLTQLQSAATGKVDPAVLNAAFSSASTATLTEMNQTQQQLAAYNLQKDQNSAVNSKLTKMKLNKSMFGQANLCSDKGC